MCGICGIVGIDGASGPRVNPVVLDAMTDQMSHRGPDGRGTWLSPDHTVGLGHRRLAIIDLSPLGAQPMSNEDGSIWVTFNGEIYNYRALRADLEARGHIFRSHTDTEVLLHLYEEIGDQVVEHLDGDFGFAIWDERRRRLLLARDRVGVKPLYYTQVGRQLLFASEIKSLLSHPHVQAEIDEQSLYHYLTYLVVPAPNTMLRGIYKLPAAGILTLELEHPDPQYRTARYWEPLPGQATLREDDLDAQWEELFERSVEKRLMSDVPVGVLFSGGVDSTLNTAFFQKRIHPQKVRTFTVGMEETTRYRDEADRAREMAQLLGTEHHEIKISQKDVVDSAVFLAGQQDEPISDPVSVPLYYVTKLARETGTTVLHAGEGADEIFCGYDNYRRFLNHNHYWHRLRYVPQAASALGFSLLRRSSHPRHRKIADVLRRHVQGQELFMASAIAYYEDEKSSILSPGFQHRTANYDSFDIVAPFYERIDEAYPNATFLQKMTFIELQLRLPELLLMRVDKMSMLNAIEVRVPFLDRDLVDFALAVPESFKLRQGISKEPVKRLAARFVGKEAVYQAKRGFGVPIQEWFQDRLGDHLRDLLDDPSNNTEQFFDKKKLVLGDSKVPFTVNRAFQLWVVYNFLNWQHSIAEFSRSRKREVQYQV